MLAIVGKMEGKQQKVAAMNFHDSYKNILENCSVTENCQRFQFYPTFKINFTVLMHNIEPLIFL